MDSNPQDLFASVTAQDLKNHDKQCSLIKQILDFFGSRHSYVPPNGSIFRIFETPDKYPVIAVVVPQTRLNYDVYSRTYVPPNPSYEISEWLPAFFKVEKANIFNIDSSTPTVSDAIVQSLLIPNGIFTNEKITFTEVKEAHQFYPSRKIAIGDVIYDSKYYTNINMALLACVSQPPYERLTYNDKYTGPTVDFDTGRCVNGGMIQNYKYHTDGQLVKCMSTIEGYHYC